MKPVAAVVTALTNRLRDSWAADLTAPPGRWPWRVSLSPPNSATAASDRPAVRAWFREWHTLAETHGLVLAVANRRIGPLAETLPTHVTIADLDTAARLAGEPWPRRLDRARRRLQAIETTFCGCDTASALRQADPLSDTDFDLAVTAAAWFRDNPLLWPGLTPRQVPIPGMHGKWLNTHRPLLHTLTGISDLTLTARPTRVHFTYVDPAHLDAGGRRHDSQTIGDPIRLPYEPSTVLICENKDTVVMFPRHPGLIVVEGGGTAGSRLLPQIPWLAQHGDVVYWGDIDADGLTILNAMRDAGIPARSILMDPSTYDNYERFGASSNPDGTPVACRPRRVTSHLTASEQRLYDDLTDPDWPRVRRIEQERIPLHVAVASLADLRGP